MMYDIRCIAGEYCCFDVESWSRHGDYYFFVQVKCFEEFLQFFQNCLDC
jgi:hypothetical protein